MKRIQMILSLFLAALMALALLPVSAWAAASCPDDKHDWGEWSTRRQATCTEKGVEYRQCKRCGKSQTRDTKALGHAWGRGQKTKNATCRDEGLQTRTCTRCGATRTTVIPRQEHRWDEGVVTKESQRFVPGEITYTCTVCRERHAEKLDPTKGLFDEFRHKPIEEPLMPISPLVIVEQPSPGWVSYYHRSYWETGHHMLHVEAEGGVEPYSYQWYCSPIVETVSASEFKQEILQRAETVAATFRKVSDRIKPVVAGWKADWLNDAGITRYPAETDPQTPAESGVPFDPNAVRVVGGTEQDYKVDAGGYTYWCVVTDSIHQTAVSDGVAVVRGMHIVEHPADATLAEKGSVTLHCRAAGGYGPYQYELIRLNLEAEDDGVETVVASYTGEAADLPVSEPGMYTYYVTDLGTEEWGHSEAALVTGAGDAAQDAPPTEEEPADDARPEDSGRRLIGDWFAGVHGRIVKLTLAEDGAYTVTCPAQPEAEKKGAWVLQEGEIYLDGGTEPELRVLEDGMLLIDANATLRREAPEIYAPAEPVANAAPGRFNGYWKAQHAAIGDAMLEESALMEGVDLFVEGTNVALGGPLFGDAIVTMTYANGALTRSEEGAALELRLQQDGLLRLTLTADGEDVALYLAPIA